MKQWSRIVIDVVPHNQQLYETVGDYHLDTNGDLHIYVSELGDPRYNFLVAIHELVEAGLVDDRNISENSISSFDKLFEDLRPEGNTDEPGDELAAPYRKEHCTATGIERIMASELNVAWKEYDKTVNDLSQS